MAKKQTNASIILIANGVNLDLLGRREPEIYGSATLHEIERGIQRYFEIQRDLYATTHTLEFFSSNHEGEFLEHLSARAYAGALINAGAWSHTSLALHDRLKALSYPFIEVHLSNISSRETIRQTSLLAPLASGVVYGMGAVSYNAALTGLLQLLAQPKRR